VSCISLTGALTVKSEKEKETIDTRIMDYLTPPTAESPIPTVNVAEGASVRETIHYERAPGEPIQIQKVILPGNRKKYLKDDLLRICVEIKGVTDINGIRIQEFVNDDLGIVNTSNYCYKITTFDELENYRDNLYVSSPSQSDNGLEIKISNENIFSINNHNGTTSLYWKDLLKNCNITREEKDAIIYFLKDVLALDALDDINMTIRDNKTVFFWNNEFNCSIYLGENNKEAFLKYGKLFYDLYVEQEGVSNPEIDNRTGKIKDKFFKGNLKISNLDNRFDIYIPSLKSKERLVYWYYVKPKRQSILNTITSTSGLK
jgi:hypothetical protein